MEGIGNDYFFLQTEKTFNNFSYFSIANLNMEICLSSLNGNSESKMNHLSSRIAKQKQLKCNGCEINHLSSWIAK